jgi:hypothetical protein
MEVSKAKPQQVQQIQATKRAEEVKQTQQRQTQAKAAESKPVQEAKPRPNVNGQGQTIGTRLSVTA